MHSCSDLCFFPNEPSARVSPNARPLRLAHSSLVMDAIGPSAARSRQSILATIPALLLRRHSGFGSYGIAWHGGFLLVCSRHLPIFHGRIVGVFWSPDTGIFDSDCGWSRVLSWPPSPKLRLLCQNVDQHRQTSSNSSPARGSKAGRESDIGYRKD